MKNDTLVRWWIARNPERFDRLHLDLISVRSGLTIGQYLKRAFLASLFTGICLAILGFFVGFSLFALNTGLQPELYNVLGISFGEGGQDLPVRFMVQIIFTLVMFISGLVIGYTLVILYPSIEKKTRETKINMGLHNAVAYMFAMRRGGAEMLFIFRSISEMSAIYGEVAYEFRQVVRDADFFGYDLVNALRHLHETTASPKLKDFLQDLLSTVESGGDIARFLNDRVHLLQEDAKFEQKQFLQFLGLVGELYVSIFIAGPLFLITIMVVMGMLGASAILELSLIGYAVLPIGSLIFILMIDTISIKDENAVKYIRAKWLHQYSDVRVKKQGGEEHLFDALKRFDSIRTYKNWLAHPLKALIKKPELTFLISGPVAIILTIFVLFHAPYGEMEPLIDYLDDNLMIALLILLVPYAVFHTLWNTKIRQIESLIPDFLDRMAGINEVGLTLSQSIRIMAGSNLGLLGYEIQHIHRDIQWGANFSDALIRFELRVKTALIARTVTLITKASVMSSSIGDLLRIAASDARMSESLRRDRLAEMFIYTAIVYLSFFVFIFVVGVINTQFLSVLAEQSTEGLSMAGQLSNIGALPLNTLDRVLYHTCLVQGICSGLIAGMMGESSIRAGVKHSCILVIAALIAFNFAF